MQKLKTFRHEFKYNIPYEESLNLRSKFNELLRIDRSYNGYMIRSLYFDSIDDNDYYDKIGGECVRKKIRLRIYENNPNLVKLEVKQKNDIHQLKESLVINVEMASELINGNYSVLLGLNDDLANKIYYIMIKGVYRPKVIIEYDRIAYIGADTTRITFDYNVKRSFDFANFFDGNICYLPLTDEKDVILEVKFDRFLEPYIGNILSKHTGRFQSVSKYVMGRNM